MTEEQKAEALKRIENEIFEKEFAKYDPATRLADSQIFLEAPQVAVKRYDGRYRGGALIDVDKEYLVILAPVRIKLAECEVVITTDKNGNTHKIKG